MQKKTDRYKWIKSGNFTLIFSNLIELYKNKCNLQKVNKLFTQTMICFNEEQSKFLWFPLLRCTA
jgi:hypothetical protein